MPHPKRADLVDIHVGVCIRARRQQLNLRQQDLADDLGVSFQQIQKYERGANRVSASRLYQVATSLRTSVAALFEGLPAGGEPIPGSVERREGQVATDFLKNSEGRELAVLFLKVRPGRVRRRILDLVRSLAEN